MSRVSRGCGALPIVSNDSSDNSFNPDDMDRTENGKKGFPLNRCQGKINCPESVLEICSNAPLRPSTLPMPGNLCSSKALAQNPPYDRCILYKFKQYKELPKSCFQAGMIFSSLLMDFGMKKFEVLHMVVGKL